MTCIAWDGKFIAADCMADRGGWKLRVVKFRVVNEPGLESQTTLAICGNFSHFQDLVRWYEKGQKPEDYPAFQKGQDNSTLLAANAKWGLRVFDMSDQPTHYFHRDQIAAFGSGRDYALGAMEMGADAKRAVEVACKFDTGCGFDVISRQICE